MFLNSKIINQESQGIQILLIDSQENVIVKYSETFQKFTETIFFFFFAT